MAPPDKDVMGVRMHVPSEPPEDDPPPQRPRAKQASRPQLEESMPPPAPSSRKDSPPGGIKLELGKHRITVSQMALVAILASFGGAGVAAKVVKDGAAETSDVLKEIRDLRKDVKAIKDEQTDLGDEMRKTRGAGKKILNYVEDTVTPIVASMRKLGVKFEYDGPPDPAAEVEFHPAPLQGSTAPPIQPKAVLPQRPTL